MNNKIEIYKSANDTEIKVKQEEDTICLDVHFIADFFNVKQLGNILNYWNLKINTFFSLNGLKGSYGR